MATEAPYIGYRSAGRRLERNNDRRASADAPLAALRGMVSGVLGAPGDIESLIRMLPGLREETVLPTSEDVEKRLPLREVSQTPVGKAATFGGQIAGGTYVGPGSPLRAIAALPSAVRRAAGDFAMAAGQPAVNVVKQKGGNWLAGSIDDALRPLKTPISPTLREDAARAGIPIDEEALSSVNALNRWIDKKLGRYIQNEMATPEDPLRALAERGVLHTDDVEQFGRNFVHPSGEHLEKLAKNPLAQAWENATDNMMRVAPASTYQNFCGSNLNLDWVNKLDPETPFYRLKDSTVPRNLGFPHLIDELRNATNPESGLPRELLLKYSDLDKVTVPQAVERVAKINEWRQAQKVLADASRANNAATRVFKEYPDKGYKWVELKAPEKVDLPQGYSVVEDKPGFRLKSPEGKLIAYGQTPEEAARSYFGKSYLEDALKYEGETMGHCVGGYCPDVLEGRSRIYSLRDAKGQPHVTVETAKGYKDVRFEAPDDVREMMSNRAHADALAKGLEDGTDEYMMYVMDKEQDLLDAWAKTNAPAEERIVQIKGKANRAPKEDYLPFVQDFVRSGKWSDVGDLGNAGLVEFTPRRQHIPKGLTGAIPRFSDLGIEGGYFTEDELAGIIKDWQTKSGKVGFAQGGSVNLKDLYAKYAEGGEVTYDPAVKAALTAALPGRQLSDADYSYWTNHGGVDAVRQTFGSPAPAPAPAPSGPLVSAPPTRTGGLSDGVLGWLGVKPEQYQQARDLMDAGVASLNNSARLGYVSPETMAQRQAAADRGLTYLNGDALVPGGPGTQNPNTPTFATAPSQFTQGGGSTSGGLLGDSATMRQHWNEYWQTSSPGTTQAFAGGTLTRNPDGSATYTDASGKQIRYGSGTPYENVAGMSPEILERWQRDYGYQLPGSSTQTPAPAPVPAPSAPQVGGGEYNPAGPGQIVTTPGQPGTYTPPGLPTAQSPVTAPPPPGGPSWLSGGTSTDGLGGLGGLQPYRPPSVYQALPVWKSEGSFFPINYNPTTIANLVSHLQSQMYV